MSKRMQQIEHYETLISWHGDRFIKAWKEYATDKYYIVAGVDGLGVDWWNDFNTLDDLRAEMGDLRKWRRSEFD